MLRIIHCIILASLIFLPAACELHDKDGEMVWPEYRIEYDSNGGLGSMESTLHQYGSKQQLRENTYHRTAWSFEGWTLSRSGAGKIYEDMSSNANKLTQENGATVTLYAKWSFDSPVMIQVATGNFLMGSDDPLAPSLPAPEHEVTVSRFSIGQHPVTQAQYLAVMENNPSHFNYLVNESNHPVETVSWFDAVEFCNKLSLQEGLEQVYSINGMDVTQDITKTGYRLPTEAEWEYAAKGGNGMGSYTMYAGSNTVGDVAWYSGNSTTSRIVKGRSPNGLNIYDMSGNVWEWCWDWYGPYQAGSAENPTGPENGTKRIMRGGSWNDPAEEARTIYRNDQEPDKLSSNCGFRIVRTINPTS